jgi:3-oxoacyl-[acyl-carrier protein] reductase
MDLELEGKVALVTGAGSGIGAATAVRLASEGAGVLLADLNRDAVEAVAADIVGDGGEAVAATVDVTDGGDVAGMVETALGRWGRLDRAVNNAGVAQPAMRIDEMSEEQFDRLIAVNAKACGSVSSTSSRRCAPPAVGRSST